MGRGMTSPADVQDKMNGHYLLLFEEVARRAGVPDPRGRALAVFERFKDGPLDADTVSAVFDALEDL